MAEQIGVQQKWHQGDHFDICLEMRAKAVALGAIEITLRQCAAMNRIRKITGALGKPQDAEDRMRKLVAERRSRGITLLYRQWLTHRNVQAILSVEQRQELSNFARSLINSII